MQKTKSLKEILNYPKSGQLDKKSVESYRKAFGTRWANTQMSLESDVWRLIIKSNLPEAEKVEEWIMEEVLPEIRKTGSYSMKPQIPKTRTKEWKKIRQDGKEVRRSLTDTVQKFIEYAKEQGSTNADWYYSNITVTTYKALKLISSAKEIDEKFRDTLNQIHLQFLGTAENLVLEIMENEMLKGTFYKDVFQIAKEKVLEFAKVVIPVIEFKPRPQNGILPLF